MFFKKRLHNLETDNIRLKESMEHLSDRVMFLESGLRFFANYTNKDIVLSLDRGTIRVSYCDKQHGFMKVHFIEDYALKNINTGDVKTLVSTEDRVVFSINDTMFYELDKTIPIVRTIKKEDSHE